MWMFWQCSFCTARFAREIDKGERERERERMGDTNVFLLSIQSSAACPGATSTFREFMG